MAQNKRGPELRKAQTPMKYLLMLFALCCIAEAKVLKGKVVNVHDGDTFTLLVGKEPPYKVRLDAIDAPEEKQAFGEVSRKALAGLVAGKIVQVDWKSKDRFDRIIGRVTVDGVNVNLNQVNTGMAWHFKKYNQEKSFAQAESAAKAQKLGLWKDANPLAPWEFRKQAKQRKG